MAIKNNTFYNVISLTAYILATIILFAACSHNTEVSFMGKPLKTAQKEFIKHLENKGFLKDDLSYKGKYLDEDVFIMLSDDVNGHYNKMILSAVFKDPDPNKARDYYEKLNKSIAKEHPNFDENDESFMGSTVKKYFNKDGGSIKVSIIKEQFVAVVMAFYDVEDDDDGSNLINTTKAEIRTFTANGISFNMVNVDGGSFKMGATEEQGNEARADEKPVHDVTVASFFISQTEVTQELWEAVMGSNPSDNKHRFHPVESISWDDCIVFINKLRAITREDFRIPTEAEWEYAARGGKKSKGYKYSGSNNLDEVAWNYYNSSSSHAVATKKPNELGIFDMSGNVFEYCSDWYDETSYQTGEPKANLNENHVIRGGNSGGDTIACRVAFRMSSPSPQYGEHYLGLRLALSK